MTTNHAPSGAQGYSARRPSGLRRLSLAMMATEGVANGFKGLGAGQGDSKPGQVLASFKAAAPFLGYGPRIVHLIDWLFSFTQPQDWCEGSHPIVWPSAALQREALGLCTTQIKTLNRHLVELGLVTMKDSPNGKRYGRRDSKGRIVEGYGFDLAPLFERQAEFAAVVAKGRAEREAMRRLRRRRTIAVNGLLQIIETAAEYGFADGSWRQLEREGRDLATALRKVERHEEMEHGVQSLERRQHEARERLESLLPSVVDQASEAVDSDPKGPENRPHIITTNLTENLKDTVMAAEKSSSDGTVLPTYRHPVPTVTAEREYRLNAGQVLDLAPRLAAYIFSYSPGWTDIVDAAGHGLRTELGVSPSLWGEACRVMGREQAALALAIVSTKPADHFTRGAGGYFAGMLRKAEKGELRLERTIWALKDQKWSGKARNSESAMQQ